MKVFEEVFLIQYLTVPTTTTERPIADIVCFDPKLIIGALLGVGKNVVGVEDEMFPSPVFKIQWILNHHS